MRMIKFIRSRADFAMPRDTGTQFFMAQRILGRAFRELEGRVHAHFIRFITPS